MVKKMKVIIKTRKDNNEVTYEYNYNGDLNIPVTTLLERINHSHEKKNSLLLKLSARNMW